MIAMRLEVARNLAIGIGVDECRRPREVGEKRDVRRGSGQIVDESGHRERQPSALAPAGDRDPRRVDRRVGADRFDRADRVGEDPAVVVRRRIEDAPGHEARVERQPRRIGVGRVADGPLGALPARVHAEVGVARGRPERALMREATPSAIADVLDDGRQRLAAADRQVQPTANG